MSDEEDYNSEEDIDYVPSDGDLGSEEEHSGDEEDLTLLVDDAGGGTIGSKKTTKGKQKKNDLAPRKRKGGIKLADKDQEAESAQENNGDTGNAELAAKIKEEDEAKKVEKEKKRTDDLWSSFLTDVKPVTKSSPKPAQTSSSVKKAVNSGDSCASPSKTTSTASASSTTTSSRPKTSNGGKITITKVFDFAGEEVKVSQEVAADSMEAQEELKKQEEEKQTSSASPALSSNTPSSSSLSAGNSVLGSKRPAAGGLGGLLNKIGKKQKMGTLDKSKMDWDNFKKKEGINEDLKIHNKGKEGYIERMSFLNRTDHRQFEIERDLRLNKTGKR